MKTISETGTIPGAAVLAIGTAVFAAPAGAQAVGDRLDVEPIASVTVVIAPAFDGRGDDDRAAQAALGEIELGGRAEYILDNGAEIGGRLVWRAQRDHPNRPGGSGSPAPGESTAVGAFSSLSNGDAARGTGPRGSLESAFVYLSGGYGEISIGRDTGVAARFQEGNVDVFSMARADGARLDVSGIAIVNTRADLTGPAEKLSYTSPRILGVRAGVSYTPVAERAGLDRNPVFGADGLPRPEITGAVEAGLNVSRRIRSSGTRIRAGLGYATGDLESQPITPQSAASRQSGSVEVWSAGGEITQDRVSIGAAILGSDDGTESGEYTAWSIGAAYAVGDWSASLTYGDADADSVRLDGDAFSIGVSKEVGKNGTFTVGYQELTVSSLSQTAQNKANRGGIVIELSLSL